MKLLAVIVTLLHVSQHALGVEVKAYNDEESVLLPCQVNVTNPQFNAVSWIVKRLSDQIVHLRGRSGDILEDQNQDYANRTSMRTDSMTTGDLSLTLKNPNFRDIETYTCIYREAGIEKSRQEVQLEVTVRPPPPSPPPSPWVIAGGVLAGHLAVAVGVFIGFVITDIQRVLQVKVEEGEQSVQLPFRWTDRLWMRMRMCRICCTCCTRCTCCTCCDLSKVVRVEWVDIRSRKLHVYKNGSDQPGEQDERYRDRTEMETGDTGDYSLTLMKPRPKDTGLYYCRVYNLNGDLLRVRTVYLEVTVQQVEVEEGAESVQLSFQTTADLPGDVTVEWWDSYDRKVHVYQNGSVEQDQRYRDRTEMKKDLMKTGDYSLKLRKPTVTDRGGYTCSIYNKDRVLLRERTVRLWVKGQHAPPTADLPRGGIDKTFYLHDLQVEEGAESVLLSFQTTADLSEDVRVQCTDEDNRKVHVYQNGSVEQDQVYGGRTEMKKEFSLILRHPRETDSGRYTCRVYNKDGDVLSEAEMGLKVKGKNKPSTPGREEDPLMAEDMV